MSIAAANLYTRNIHKAFVNRNMTHEEETGVAKLVSLLVKVGAVAFILALPLTYAIQLQLLGGIWIYPDAAGDRSWPVHAHARLSRPAARLGCGNRGRYLDGGLAEAGRVDLYDLISAALRFRVTRAVWALIVNWWSRWS